MTRRWCMEKSRVELVSTTEDPTDTLEYHFLMQKEKHKTKVVSAFRPDRRCLSCVPRSAPIWKSCRAAAGCRSRFPGYAESLGPATASFSARWTPGFRMMAFLIYIGKTFTMDEVETIWQKAVSGEAIDGSGGKSLYQRLFVSYGATLL